MLASRLVVAQSFVGLAHFVKPLGRSATFVRVVAMHQLPVGLPDLIEVGVPRDTEDDLEVAGHACLLRGEDSSREPELIDQVISILRGSAWATFGSSRRSTPCSSLALIRSVSMRSLRVKRRENPPI